MNLDVIWVVQIMLATQPVTLNVLLNTSIQLLVNIF